MKKLTILVGLVALIMAILLSGCGDNNVTGNNVASQPSTVNSDVVPTRLGCGDGICAEDEVCDETTHRTGCPEDCGIKCGSYVKLSGPECEGDCSVSGNTIIVRGTSKIKIYLENIGETSTDKVSSSFKCDYSDGSGLYFKTELGEKNGYLWDDYFENNVEEKTVNSAITGNNKLTYYLSLKGKTLLAKEVICRTSFSSNSFSNAMTFNYNLNFR